MDDGEVETSDRALLSNPVSCSNFQGSSSVESFIDDILKNTQKCTHTHTCNPPGPYSAHTHTCYHTHTEVLASTEEDDNQANSEEHSGPKPRRSSSGNREAVRKYREKKKAHTAYLEEEVKKLRMLNQQLVRKLQGQAMLEAENLRLRSLLADLRGKIDGVLGVFPYQRQCNTASASLVIDRCGLQPSSGSTGLQCHINLPCHYRQVGSSSQVSLSENEKTMASWGRDCEPSIINNQVNGNDMSNAEGQTVETVETRVSSSPQAD